MRLKPLCLKIAALAVLALVIAAPVPLFNKIALGFVGLAALESLGARLFGTLGLASTGSTFANVTNALKRRYDDSFLGVVTWKTGPLAAMIAKKAWDGEFPVYPIRVGNSPARSATYATAASKSENATYGFTRVKQAQPPWVQDYGRATIAGLLLKAAGSKMGTFYDKFVAQIDGIMDATALSFATKVYRNGFGSIGNISAATNVATTTLELAVKEDVVLYEVGMDLQFSSADSTATLRNAGGVLTVTAINQNLGTLTMNAVINTNTGTVAGDFIFASGDRQDSATPTRLALGGLDAWMPTAAPAGGENFYNLGDRNLDGRLLGIVIDATTAGYSEEAALIAAVTEADRYGGKPKMAFFNPTRYANLLVQGQGRYRPTTVKGPMGIGFDGVVVSTNYGDVRVFSDRFCPRKRAYVLDMDEWTVYGVGDAKFPTFLEHDGNKILRQTADDGVECRVGYYGAMGTNAPIHNVVIKFEA